MSFQSLNDSDMQSANSMGKEENGNSKVYPSAYTAPAHPRPQAEPHHSFRTGGVGRSGDGGGGGGNGGRQDERGDLTADNLERIPEADHVAPGIRLETVGNDPNVEHDKWESTDNVPTVQEPESVDRIKIDGRGRLDGDSNRMSGQQQRQQQQSSNLIDGSDGMLLDGERNESGERVGGLIGRASSSMALSGRSSLGAMDQDGSERHDDDDYQHHDGEEDDMEGYDEDDDEKALVHGRVGGSGATAENASKGTSVGHFGPRGEAIPGVPPHLDPRQPHFRPPSPSAASVLSVAVQPPVSPKLQASAGLGLPSVGGSNQAGSNLAEIVDSGDETESFDNGAMTPTLSDDFPEDETEERIKLPSEQFDTQGGSKSSSAFGLQRMNLDSDDITPSISASGPYQVSFSPVVTSHHRGSVSGYSNRAPSIAATAGSSRAPSTRGLSPPASTSRAGTTEGSSVEEFESTGTGLDGEGGAETPSVGRSRRSSYSAPSSEVDNGAGLINDDVNNRARGSTLVPSSHNHANSNIPEINTSGAVYAGSGQGDMGDMNDDGPSLAPSEAGSDSTRSMTYESSVGHGGQGYGGLPFGHASASTDRLPSGWTSVAAVNSSPALFENNNTTLGGSGSGDLANVDAPHLLSSGMSPSNSGFKGPLSSSSAQPMLPSLLAIKRASRRQDSGPASTAATAGTASPASSLSIDGDFDEPPGGYPSES